jgi:hypothetical protein
MDTGFHIATPLAIFTSVCEALEIPAGSQRHDAFLKLPPWMQEAIVVEIEAIADRQLSDED